MQTACHLDQGLPPPRSGDEVPSELSIDLQRLPVARPPLAEAVGHFTLLLGLDHQQRAVAGSADLDSVLGSEPETVAARNVMKPAVRELERFRGCPQCNHHGTDIEVLHDPVSDRNLGARQSEPGDPAVTSDDRCSSNDSSSDQCRSSTIRSASASSAASACQNRTGARS